VATKKPPSPRPLAVYDAKRDFSATPEPRPAVPAKGRRGKALSFCVQKHLASHLHYDFRLEHNGVLLSWAVPRGPSLNPADKRMAVHVEDHPVDYGSFEGVIPSGYGAGIVLLWDRGTWEPEAATADVDAALAKGELKFRLDGVKLKGSWVLVRTRRQAKGPEQWLLIKHRDAWAGDVDVATEAPQSVKSFGDLSDVLAAHGGAPADWRTDPPVRGGDAGRLLAEVMGRAAGAVAPKPSRAVPARTGATGPGSANVPKSALTLGKRQPKLSNQTKVLYPATGFTKGDLVDYYTRAAPLILPQLAGRAVTLKRFPDGVDGKSFFEKRCASHRPDWVRTVRVAGQTAKDKTLDYCLIEDLPSLVWAANLAAIELHVPLALAAAPDRPTTMVFDLDPGPPATQADCVPVALRLKAMLDQLKLKSVVKRSGGKGLHVMVPLNAPAVTFDQTKAFARAVALTLERDDPKTVIASMSRDARRGKVFIDWSQNDRNKTTVCAFSVRAREEPTVSWPVAWADLAEGRPPPPVRASDRLDRTGATRLMKVMGTVQALPPLDR
jgi:bifunctional non-homologous end joining protein LigD